MRSRLLTGTVRHRRARQAEYDFTHRVWYLELDLDEIAAVAKRSRLLSVGRRGILEFRPGDHLEPPHAPLAEAVRARLRGQGLEIDGWRIALVTYPRVFGFVFNPVSFYLCRDRDGVLRHVIAEVSNTHGERTLYDFPRDPSTADPVYRSAAGKRMYVSPFIGPDARYELRVRDEATRLRISISESEGEERTLFAPMQLQRHELTDAALLRALVRDPLVTFKTVGLIGWHAWRLRRLGVKWIRHTRLGTGQVRERSTLPE